MRRYFLRKYIHADVAVVADIYVVEFRKHFYFWRLEGIIRGKSDRQVEFTALPFM